MVMNGQTDEKTVELTARISRLVRERGWNQDEFARQAGLNRQTASQILQQHGTRRLRNDTICRCARALGVSVDDLHHAPLQRLLSRMLPPAAPASPDAAATRLYEEACQPELQALIARNPERARHLSALDIDELLSLQGTGGPLSKIGVDHFVELIERKRKIIEQVQTIASTEYPEML